MKKKYIKKRFQQTQRKRSNSFAAKIYPILGSIVVTSVFSLVAIKFVQIKMYYLHGGNIIYPYDKVLGVQTANTSITIDYGSQIAVGHPEVFGGAHGPRASHAQAWQALKLSGVTSMRRDINLQYEAPLKTDLTTYLNENYGKDNTKNFNWSRIQETDDMFKNAKSNGMKTMAVLVFVPPWLSSNSKNNGVPVNWDVYEDVVKKLYSIHRPYLDSIELTNEPDLNTFLTTSFGRSRFDAYREIFIHASRAIRQVDSQAGDGKRIKIGGSVTSFPYQTAYLESLLSDTEASSHLDFVSYHTYGYTEPTSAKVKQMLTKYQKETLPIYITEWNKSSKTTEYSPYHTASPAITYTGSKLIQFLNQGYAGANYFTMSENDPKRPNTVFSVYGIYQMRNAAFVPFPQLKTWTVLSSDSQLGSGESKIFNTDFDQSTGLDVLAFKNSNGKIGFAVNNSTSVSYTIVVSLNATGLNDKKTIVAYEASDSWDATKTKGSLDLDFATQNKVQLFVPASTLISVVIN